MVRTTAFDPDIASAPPCRFVAGVMSQPSAEPRGSLACAALRKMRSKLSFARSLIIMKLGLKLIGERFDAGERCGNHLSACLDVLEGARRRQVAAVQAHDVALRQFFRARREHAD